MDKLPSFMQICISLTYYTEDDFKALDSEGIKEFKEELEQVILDVNGNVEYGLTKEEKVDMKRCILRGMKENDGDFKVPKKLFDRIEKHIVTLAKAEQELQKKDTEAEEKSHLQRQFLKRFKQRALDVVNSLPFFADNPLTDLKVEVDSEDRAVAICPFCDQPQLLDIFFEDDPKRYLNTCMLQNHIDVLCPNHPTTEYEVNID